MWNLILRNQLLTQSGNVAEKLEENSLSQKKMYAPNIISLFSKLETFDYLENPKICTGIDILMNQYNWCIKY